MRGREEVEGDSLLNKLQEQWLMTDTQISQGLLEESYSLRDSCPTTNTL